ncbi:MULTISPECIES: hypothetical protein [Methylobacter]
MLLLITSISIILVFVNERSIEEVLNSAETVAGNTPYCLQVTGDGDYREVRTRNDISIFNMPVKYLDIGVYAHHHAVMVVERNNETELWHWSYWNHAFLGSVIGPPAIYCTPQPHFLAAIAKHSQPEPDFIRIRITSMTFSAPKSFRLSASSGESCGIRFRASSPLFEAVGTVPDDKSETYSSFTASFVNVDFGKRKLNEWLHRNRGDVSQEVKDAGHALGLKKQEVWYLPSAQKTPTTYKPSAEYYSRSSNGEILTLISCAGEARGKCFHVFYHEGWTYHFYHEKEFLKDWHTMQERLVLLTKSFISSGKINSFEENFAMCNPHKVFKLAPPNS